MRNSLRVDVTSYGGDPICATTGVGMNSKSLLKEIAVFVVLTPFLHRHDIHRNKRSRSNTYL